MTLEYIYSKIFSRLHGKCILNSKIEKGAVVYWNCNIINTHLGKYSYIGHDSMVMNVEIGNYCSLSDHVYIGGAEHPMEWVSTSPVFQNISHSGSKKRFSKLNLPEYKQTKIGCDVWIGHGVIIKAGVSIGHGAVIGAGSVVTKDIPPYAIVAGVPAKILRYRFDDNTITRLLESQWWQLPDEKIQKVAKYINNPKVFLDKL